jgi:nucleoside phosphorylase
MARVAIVAAMFREVHPLVRDMQPFKYLPDKRVQIYQSDDAVVAYAGMGKQQAEVACRAALATGEISAVVSAGWAGGLNAQVAAGKVV